MIGKTLYSFGFSNLLSGSRARARRLAKETNALDGLAALVSRFIQAELFETKEGQRKPAYPPWATFIAFLG